MSGFGDNFEQAEVDPAAEFLAREQDELAGLEDEVKPAAATVITSTLTNGGMDKGAVYKICMTTLYVRLISYDSSIWNDLYFSKSMAK